MRLIICGGVQGRIGDAERERLGALHAASPIQVVYTGGSGGVDLGAELWADEKGIPVRRLAARWSDDGATVTGFSNARNVTLVADAIVAFPGGPGTEALLRMATDAGLIVHDWRSEVVL